VNEEQFYTLPGSGRVFRSEIIGDTFRFIDINHTRSWRNYKGCQVGCSIGYLVDKKGRLLSVAWNLEPQGEIEIDRKVTGLTASDLRPCNISTKTMDINAWRTE
jgi:hypothetical protein